MVRDMANHILNTSVAHSQWCICRRWFVKGILKTNSYPVGVPLFPLPNLEKNRNANTMPPKRIPEDSPSISLKSVFLENMCKSTFGRNFDTHHILMLLWVVDGKYWGLYTHKKKVRVGGAPVVCRN